MAEATHSIALELGAPFAATFDAGSQAILEVRARCAQGCELTGQLLQLTDAQNNVVASTQLAAPRDGAHPAQIAFTVPPETGAHHWSLVLPGAGEKNAHGKTTLPVAFETRAHDSSLAVWDVPSPLKMGAPFKIMAGATCTSGCDLSAREIEILDAAGTLVGRGTLGPTPWPKTRALYWTQVALTAPGETGRANWSLRFAAQNLELPHSAAAYKFGAEIVPPPEHVVTVKVLERESGAPLADAQVRLGVYFADTDAAGLARVETPKGDYELDVLKNDYDTNPIRLEVTGDLAVEVAMTVVPKQNPDSYWYYKRGEES